MWMEKTGMKRKKIQPESCPVKVIPEALSACSTTVMYHDALLPRQ